MTGVTEAISSHRNLCFYFYLAAVVTLLCVFAHQIFFGITDYSFSELRTNYSFPGGELLGACYGGKDARKANQVKGYLQPKASGIDGVSYLGGLNPSYNYSVFSLTIENKKVVTALNYAFCAPLTTLAWQRIGYRSLVVVVVSHNERNWKYNAFLVEVVKRILEIDGFVLFLQSGIDQLVSLSQVGRLMAPSIASRLCPDMLDVFMITSDVDLWPLSSAIYTLPLGKKIVSLHAYCCGFFHHKDKLYRMLPMSNIGMLSSTWNDVMTAPPSGPPLAPLEMLRMLFDEFGPPALLPVTKGNNVNWYRDQRLISIRIQRWVDRFGNKSIDFVERDVGIDRLDRVRWTTRFKSLKRFNDTHIFLNAFRTVQWQHKLLPIIKVMYKDNSTNLIWCQGYFNVTHDLTEKAGIAS